MSNKLLGIVLPHRNMVYWPVPKVACTTLREFFAREMNLEFKEINGPNGPQFMRTNFPYPDFFNFAYVRNPFERFLSLYNQKIYKHVDRKVFPEQYWVEGMNFREFILRIMEQSRQERHYMLQSELIPDGVHCYKMERDLWLKMLTPANTSQRVDHYTQYTKDLVYQHYMNDFIRYGYHYTGYLRD